MINKIVKKNYVLFILLFLLIFSFYVAFRYDNIVLMINNIDNVIANYVSFDSNIFLKIMKVFTFLGSFYVPVIILFVMYISKVNRKDALFLTILYCALGLFICLIKYLVNRDRPTAALIDMPITPSFPSGHSFTSMVFYFMFGYIVSNRVNHKYRYLVLIGLVVISLVIGFSRIFLGVHYFSDVIGGFLLSFIVIMICINVYNILLEELK